MSLLDVALRMIDVPEFFEYGGRRYPLQPLLDHVAYSEEAQEAVLEAFQQSEIINAAPREKPDGSPLTEPGVPLPEVISLRATGARYPDSQPVESERVAGWLAGTHNLSFKSRVWFDLTPDPDTVKALPAMLHRVRWRVAKKGVGTVTFKGTGIAPSPRPHWPDRMISQGRIEGVESIDMGFEGGIFLQEYALSGGYHASLRFTAEGEYSVWCEVMRPDGRTLSSAPLVGLKVS